ncbi:TrmH family RNA methyltransferase [Alkalibacter saccharofermentans]|uniref:RNA methyltransferase, TrmH family n=1 Tax=Alkalibacter saccharofermentans DSM 14828 TaxID=1120975 RepID=A0A1M4UDW1_9FIRM|nr:RNA methyltransferase [Alkalibacter saccharofermentans]SHE54874.1 RNA methyltransferase, TrmH family [Alkalibacter saccharofermentans DSM 14828]
MLYISSKDNQKLKMLIKLKQKKHRDQFGNFVLEGFKSVELAMENGRTIDSIFMSTTYYRDNLKKYKELAGVASERIYIVEDRLLKASFDTVSPQGIMALCSIEDFTFDKIDYEKAYRVVMLDRVQDPGNLGTIIRTADAAGYDMVVCTRGCADVYSPKAVRATMGSVLNIDILREVNGEEFIAYVKNLGYKIISSSLEGSLNYKDVSVTDKSVLVFGNEGSGIDKTILNESDHLVKIPIYGKAESLNVSVAAGILLYHFSPDY